jgi:uncharacterized protein YceK
MSRLAAILVAAALSGCGTIVTQAQLDRALAAAPSCQAGTDCDAKWGAAQAWVAKNIRFELAMSGEYLLQTTGPAVLPLDPRGQRLAATVKREADGPGRFKIVASLRCGNEFGCLPDWEDALADFNRTVAAATP